MFVDEHYFQNYINRRFSPHAKPLVLKYEASLAGPASSTDSHLIPGGKARRPTRPEVCLGPPGFRSSSKDSISLEVSQHKSHSDPAIAPMPMPEASMPLAQCQRDPSAMKVFCDTAQAGRMGNSPSSITKEGDNEISDASALPDSGSWRLPQRKIAKTQKNQRRSRKAARRKARVSDMVTEYRTPTNSRPTSGAFSNAQADDYSDPLMHGQWPAYFGHPYSIQTMGPELQSTNVYHSNQAQYANVFHPYGGPPRFTGQQQLGGYPHVGGDSRLTGANRFAFDGLPAHHALPYIGGYYNSEYNHEYDQSFGKDSVTFSGGMGGYARLRDGSNEVQPLVKPVTKDADKSINN